MPSRIRLWVALPLAVVNPVVASLYCGRTRLAAWLLVAAVLSTAVLWLGPVALPGLLATVAVGLGLGIGPSIALIAWLLWRVRRDPVARRWPWPALVAAFVATNAIDPSLWLDQPIGHFTIPSGSMVPAIAIGDRILAENPARPRAARPEPGDIIIFQLPSNPDEVWVKRLIARGGDRVRLAGGVPVVNGVPAGRRRLDSLPETVALSGLPPASLMAVEETLPHGRRYVVMESGPSPPADTPEFHVPEGHVFVLGDNRGDAMDSRLPAVGFIPEENIVARAVMRYRFGAGGGVWPLP